MGQVITVDDRNFTDRQRRLMNTDSGSLAEELVALEYNLHHRPSAADWYDCMHRDTEAKTEVKSTSSTVGEKYPRAGRFRLWEEQLQSLHAANATGTAWIAFVLFDMDEREARMRRVEPATAAEYVRQHGGWNKSGHASWNRQKKVPHTTVF